MFRWLLQLFSPYAHPFERRAENFLRSVRSTSSPFEVQKKLAELMQENLVVLNLWLEKKYKNYRYLTKSVRRKLYENTDRIFEDFAVFARDHDRVDSKALHGELAAHHLGVPNSHNEQLIFLRIIMEYLRPGRIYIYEESINFGKLLRDPSREKLIGDCNQIVTLYCALFAKRFPLSNLQIKLLPGHVCLHFQGIDIEATNGTFRNYETYEQILPITELISTNLLDVADPAAAQAALDPRSFLKCAQLALHISSARQIVERNLHVAYRNLGLSLLNRHEFESAFFYLEKLGDRKLLESAFRNAVFYHLKKGSLSQAYAFARRSTNSELLRDCALEEYRRVSQEVKGIKTIADARAKKAKYSKLLELARAAGRSDLEESIRRVLKQIGSID